MKAFARRFTFAAALTLLSAAFALPALADGGQTRVFYPTTEDAVFTVDVPSEWTLKSQGEVGAEDYFEVEGPNGLELSFRTVPGGDLDAAVSAHVAYLKENFSDIKAEDAVKTKLNDMDVLILPVTGTDEDGSVRDLGGGWFQINPTTVGELWYNVEKTDSAGGAGAIKVLESLKKAGG